MTKLREFSGDDEKEVLATESNQSRIEQKDERSQRHLHGGGAENDLLINVFGYTDVITHWTVLHWLIIWGQSSDRSWKTEKMTKKIIINFRKNRSEENAIIIAYKDCQ